MGLPVAKVGRANISGHSTSTAASPAPIVPADPSVPHSQLGVQHLQDTLSAVQNPAPPIDSPPAQSRSARRAPGPANGRATPGVSYVYPRFDGSAAAEGIETMTSGASSLLDMWPLDGLMKLWPTRWKTQTGEPAPQPREVDLSPQPNDLEDTTEKASKVLQEEDMMDYKAPPPYRPPSEQSSDLTVDAKHDN